MTGEIAAQIPPHTTLQTTEVDQPFPVRRTGVPAEERDVVTVRDEVVIGDRSIIRAEVGKGFWHVAVNRSVSASIPIAIFEPHETVCFSFPCRLVHH